jgi:hypothetical protein
LWLDECIVNDCKACSLEPSARIINDGHGSGMNRRAVTTVDMEA